MALQNLTAGEFIVSESPVPQSRAQVLLAAGTAPLQAGQVLGRVTATGKHAAHDEIATDGRQTAVAVLYASAPANRSYDTRATVVERDAEVDGSRLNGGAGASLNAISALATRGIVVRVFAGGGTSYFAPDYVQSGYVY